MFKVGQKVRCIKDSGSRLIVNGIYTVEHTSGVPYNCVYIKGCGIYSNNRFEQINEEREMFEKGQKLICIDDAGVTTITRGRLYIVEGVQQRVGDTVVKVRTNDGEMRFHKAWRFQGHSIEVQIDVEQAPQKNSGCWRAKVMFPNSPHQEYTYACDIDDIEIGSYVLVPASRFNAGGRMKYSMAVVTDMNKNMTAQPGHVKLLKKVDVQDLDDAEERRKLKEIKQAELDAMRRDIKRRAEEAAMQKNARELLEAVDDTIGLRMLEQIDKLSREIAEL